MKWDLDLENNGHLFHHSTRNKYELIVVKLEKDKYKDSLKIGENSLITTSQQMQILRQIIPVGFYFLHYLVQVWLDLMHM